MGLFGPKRQTEITDSIYPIAAKEEVLKGNLPQINTSSLLLRKGEYCIYLDKAILNDYVKKKIYSRIGGSSPGLFKGHRINYGRTKPREYTEIEQHKGILYITNKRIIFQGNGKCFDKQHKYLSAIEPYSNAVVLQYGEKNFELVVPDGSIVNEIVKHISV